MGSDRRTIFHIDMDAFFASVEQRDNPEFRSKPVIVGGRPGSRGVVSAASYEARAFGIHSAMPINEAYSRCPKGIFVAPRMQVYSSVSNEVMRLFARFSPAVEQVSIDEAFLDMTGTDRLFGSPEKTARRISEQIRVEQGITGSIGCAPNKFCAKIASDLNKPAGITFCPMEPEAIAEWLAPMPVGKIWGVGIKSAGILNRMGICTIGDLQRMPLENLLRRFGKQGAALFYLSRGIDGRPVGTDTPGKSIAREHTFPEDSSDPGQWRAALFSLSQDVARKARKQGVKGGTVHLTYRTPDFSRHTIRRTLPRPTNVARFIFEGVLSILDQLHEPAFRLLGVGISALDETLQTDLFIDCSQQNWELSERAIDEITNRFGISALRKGSELGPGAAKELR